MAISQKDRSAAYTCRNKDACRRRCREYQRRKRAEAAASGKTEQINQKAREYYRLNPEKKKAQAARWDYVLWWRRAMNRVYGEINTNKVQKQKSRDRAKKWAIENPDKARENKRKHYRKRRKELPWISLRQSISSRLKDMLAGARTTSVSSLSVELLGCSIQEFSQFIELKFTPEMRWKNYGKKYGWHLDHILPCAMFDGNNPEDLKKCFHYSNYQPLMAIDNLKKGDLLPDGRRGRDLKLEGARDAKTFLHLQPPQHTFNLYAKVLP